MPEAPLAFAVSALRTVEHSSCPEGVLANEAEGFRFMQVFERAHIAGFRLAYIEVCRGDERVCIAPYFATHFRLDTMVTGGVLKKMLSLVRLPLACVGHPSTDVGRIDGEVSAEVLQAINAHLFSKASLIAYKTFLAPLPLSGFASAAGLPQNVLAVKNYFANLRHNRRKNIKRRLALSAPLRFEALDAPTDLPLELAQTMFALYEQTAQRGDFQFEALTLAYFQQTASLSQFILAYEGERLIGFVQNLVKGPRMVSKYIGMDYQRSEPYGLYFALLIKVIESADAAGLDEVDFGQTSYYFKKLMGCEQVATNIYFRHANPVFNWILGRCKFLLEPSAAELR